MMLMNNVYLPPQNATQNSGKMATLTEHFITDYASRSYAPRTCDRVLRRLPSAFLGAAPTKGITRQNPQSHSTASAPHRPAQK